MVGTPGGVTQGGAGGSAGTPGLTGANGAPGANAGVQIGDGRPPP